MLECESVWGCRRFEALYRDVILPLLNRSEFEQRRLLHPSYGSGDHFKIVETFKKNKGIRNEISEISEHQTLEELPQRSLVKEQDKSWDPEVHSSTRSESLSSAYDEDTKRLYDEYKIYKNPSIQALWDALFQQIYYFATVLGHSSSSHEDAQTKILHSSTAMSGPFKKSCYISNCRDENFDTNRLKEIIETFYPDLIQVPLNPVLVSSPFNTEPQTSTISTIYSDSAAGNQQCNAMQVNCPEVLLLRQSILIFLVDFFSAKINLRHDESLHLIATTIQALNNDIPSALNVEQCCSLSNGMESVQQSLFTSFQSSMKLLPLGVIVIEIASARFRKEQLHHLLCLKELAMDLYPLDQTGVADVSSVGVISFSFFKNILSCGFLENSISALRFLMLESTRQRPQFITSKVEEKDDPLKFSECMDRAWSRRLAEILVRLLIVLCARFHPPPFFVLNLMELLEGAAFEEHAVRVIRHTFFSKKQERRMTSITSRDFDLASLQDKHHEAVQPTPQLACSMLSESESPYLDITLLLTLLFLDIINPSVEKWEIICQNDTLKKKSLHDVRAEKPRFSSWFSTEKPHEKLPEYDWLMKKSVDHDVQPFWIDTSFYGQLLSFAVSVGYVKPSDTRKFQLGLSPAWNIFTKLKEYVLDRLEGSSPLSKIIVQIIHSLVSQILLPLNTQWSGQIMRLEKIARHKNQKNKPQDFNLLKSDSSISLTSSSNMFFHESSCLEPIIALVNRICSLLPISIPLYSPIVLSLIDSFPWLELTSVCSNDFFFYSYENSRFPTSKKLNVIPHHLTAGAELCEIHSDRKYIDEEIPSITGMVCDINGSETDLFPLGERSGSYPLRSQDPFRQNMQRSSDSFSHHKETEDENQMLRSDDLNFLLPLFAHVIRLVATMCAAGHRSTAVQLATKLTSQPSLLGFFIPHTAERLQDLFAAIDSGLLQRQFVSTFQKRRSSYMLQMRGREALPRSSPSVMQLSSCLDEQADTEEEDKILQCLIDQTISSILTSTTVIFRFFIACMSPRLFVTRPAPPPLLPQNSPNALTPTKILNWAYYILATQSRSSLGMTHTNAVLNGFQLLGLKACVFDGLAGSFEAKDADSVRLLSAFLNLLPIFHEDLLYLKSFLSGEVLKEASFYSSHYGVTGIDYGKQRSTSSSASIFTKETADQLRYSSKENDLIGNIHSESGVFEQKENSFAFSSSTRIQILANELLGRLAISFMTYCTSIIFRLGYRNRYNTSVHLEDNQPQANLEEATISKSPKTSVDTRTKLPNFNLFYCRGFMESFQLHDSTPILPTLTHYVVSHIIPLLDVCYLETKTETEIGGGEVPSDPNFSVTNGFCWKLAAVTFKFLRCILRGPLPFLNEPTIDCITREPFKSHPGNEEGAEATSWLMRSFLTLDSRLLDILIRVSRFAWCRLISPWNVFEFSANLVHLQIVESGMDILVTLFQRDILFLYWWRRLRHMSITEKSEYSARWQYVSNTVPVHVNFLGKTSLSFSVSPSLVKSNHFFFLFEIASSERHPVLRKQAIRLIHQLNQRVPRFVAASLNQFHVEILQSALASMLRDIELGEYEQWERLDLLGLLTCSDFPLLNSPEVFLNSCFVEECEASALDDVSLDARLRDCLSVWSSSGGLEISCFYEEIVSMNSPVMRHTMASLLQPYETNSDRDSGEKSGSWNSTAKSATSSFNSEFNFMHTLRWQSSCDSSPIVSNKTCLPVHYKLEKRILAVEDIVMTTTDTAAWNAVLHIFDDIPAEYIEWIASALPHLSQDFLPPIPYLVPFLGAEFVLQSEGQNLQGISLFNEAISALMGDFFYDTPGATKQEATTNRETGSDKFIPLLSQVMFTGCSQSTSQLVALQFLIQGLKSALYCSPCSDRDSCETVPTVLQLLGFIKVSDSFLHSKATLSTSHLYYTTSLPLPFITSPFASKGEGASPPESNLDNWMHNSLIIMDSLALIVEDVNLWINDLPGILSEDVISSSSSFSKNISTSDLQPDCLMVYDAFTNPASYSSITHHVYQDAHSTLASLEIMILLLSNPRTADAMLYLLFIRFPHRHAILYQLITTQWNIPPSLLFSVRKLICASWVQLISLETHLCASYLSESPLRKPVWLVRNYPEYILKARLETLQNQCVQVSEGLWALFQASVGGMTTAPTVRSGPILAQGIPTILSCILAHLGSSELYCVEQESEIWGSLKDEIFSRCRTVLSYISSCDFWYLDSLDHFNRQAVREFVVSLLHPHQVLLTYKSDTDKILSFGFNNPLHYVMDFNHRSLAVFTAQRLSVRFTELFAASLELIVTEFHTSQGFYIDDVFDKKSGFLRNAQHIFTACLIHCLDYLNSSSLRNYRSRYCLMSIMGSLFNSLVYLTQSHVVIYPDIPLQPCNGFPLNALYNKADEGSNSVDIDCATLKYILQKIMSLCVTWSETANHAQQQPMENSPIYSIQVRVNNSSSSSSVNDISDRCLSQVLRLRLYAAVLQTLKLAKCSSLESEPSMLLLGINSSLNLIEPFSTQLQKDLLIHENYEVHPLYSQHRYLVNSKIQLQYSEDPLLLVKQYSGLSTYPADSCVPVLKILIEFGMVQTHCITSSITDSLMYQDKTCFNHNSTHLAGHMLLPASQWTSSSSTLQALQLWFLGVFENRNIRPSTGPNYSLPPVVEAFNCSGQDPLNFGPLTAYPQPLSSVSVIQLALSLLHVLIMKPALCEVLLARSIPLHHPIYMLTQAAIEEVPLEATCRTILLAAPFFPRLNIPFSTSSYGFPPFLPPERTHSFSHLPSAQCGVNFMKLRKVFEETPIVPSVALLPIYMLLLNDVLTKVKHLQINFTIYNRSEDQELNDVTVERASWYFFKWWLTRDHQFSSCFRCFNQQIENLQHILTEDFPSIYQRPLTLPPSVEVQTENEKAGIFKTEHRESSKNQESLLDALLCTQYLQERFTNLCLILVLTSHCWLQLLFIVSTTLQTQAQEKEIKSLGKDVDNTKPTPFRIPYDDFFLTLQFQNNLIQSAVLMVQLSALKSYTEASTSGVQLHTDVVRTLLLPLPFKPSHLDVVLPCITQRQGFLVNALHCIKHELLIANTLLYQEPMEKNKEQIQEQLKRSILERMQSLIALFNAVLIGTLATLPLDRKKVPQLTRDIFSFLYNQRYAGKKLSTDDLMKFSTFRQTTTYETLIAGFMAGFYVRLLGLSSSLLITGIQMLIDSEYLPLGFSQQRLKSNMSTKAQAQKLHMESNLAPRNLGSSMPPFTPHRTILRHIFSANNAILGGPLQVQALHLCARVCSALIHAKEIPGFDSSDWSNAKNGTLRPLPLRLLRCSAKAVCANASILLKMFLDVDTT